jgi:hypothetical protein
MDCAALNRFYCCILLIVYCLYSYNVYSYDVENLRQAIIFVCRGG